MNPEDTNDDFFNEPPSEDELNELFGDPQEFNPEPRAQIFLPEELRPLLEWAFTTDEGGAATIADIPDKAEELGCLNILIELGWAYAVSQFFAAFQEVQEELDENARKGEWDVGQG